MTRHCAFTQLTRIKDPCVHLDVLGQEFQTLKPVFTPWGIFGNNYCIGPIKILLQLCKRTWPWRSPEIGHDILQSIIIHRLTFVGPSGREYRGGQPSRLPTKIGDHWQVRLSHHTTACQRYRVWSWFRSQAKIMSYNPLNKPFRPQITNILKQI